MGRFLGKAFVNALISQESDIVINNGVRETSTNLNYLNTKAKREMNYDTEIEFGIGVKITVNWIMSKCKIKTKPKQTISKITLRKKIKSK